ncbi:4'-phosphopantetheinyl transferase superfamily protein [Rhodoferax sp. PAMC 29310]|uniref:4'-phosphopantetheinyl transferase family protein n=1 Tax=Rhodoferax sp. PAMC 29310 TaxID=2822760 RepID=UPI001B337776|nr:4'-phosphopantetheinyl transferase superfamily protein [Rhodoferax sp. PAMC 29310]
MRTPTGPVPVVQVDTGSPWSALVPRSEPLFVIAVKTPDNPDRTVARQAIRTCLTGILGEMWGCEPADVTLTHTPGQPLRAQGPHSPEWGLSVSHEAGLSVAAVNRLGPVGVDIVCESPAFDWHAVAHDYMGPAMARQLASQPLVSQNQQFLRAWARHEAGLKCLSLGLVEWSPALQSRLAALQVVDLELPAGWLGTIVCP